jgi:hypothetical protein
MRVYDNWRENADTVAKTKQGLRLTRGLSSPAPCTNLCVNVALHAAKDSRPSTWRLAGRRPARVSFRGKTLIRIKKS